LKIDDIGIYDNFMELGGHSLLANRLTLRINDTFGIKLSLMEVLTSGLTVADMVNLLRTNFLRKLTTRIGSYPGRSRTNGWLIKNYNLYILFL